MNLNEGNSELLNERRASHELYQIHDIYDIMTLSVSQHGDSAVSRSVEETRGMLVCSSVFFPVLDYLF